MMNRREFIAASAVLTLGPKLFAEQTKTLIKRAIPRTGEKLPVIGLGSSATFAQVARGEDIAGLREVIKMMVDRGATVIDTAPAYGASEQVAGNIAEELGATKKIFWATKVNVAGRGPDAKADPDAAKLQIEASFSKLKVPVIDLIQVHNLADVPVHMNVLTEFKRNKRVRYIGATITPGGNTPNASAYDRLRDVMRNEPIDFIGIDYAVDNRDVEETILPLAIEKKIGVLVYLPFGRTRLFQRAAGKPLPEWAADFDATTWAQFFLKYVISHPAVTVVTPSTTKAEHMADNLGGGVGRLPNEATRKKMAELVDAWPQV